MLKRLLNIRLSYIYPVLFVVFFGLLSVIRPASLTAGQLALYSVNTFLFGFYFVPLLGAQKTRVDTLNEAGRTEAMTIEDILTQAHLLAPEDRHQLKIRLKAYLDSIIENPRVKSDNLYYDELLRFSKLPRFKDDSVMDTIYGRISDTQEDRSKIQNLLSSDVYSHEWLVVWVLFTITVYFVMQTDYNGVLFFRFMLAILCTGLALMMVILLKFATLTHKEAKKMWQPLKDLRRDHLDDVVDEEISRVRDFVSAQATER